MTRRRGERADALPSASRRAVLGSLAASAPLLSFSRCAALAEDAAPAPPAEAATLAIGDRFVRMNDDPAAAKPLSLEDVSASKTFIAVYPQDPKSGAVRRETRSNLINLIKLDPAALKEGTASLAASGVVGYSALCTHKACTVNSWKAAENHWRCFCHLSEFDAADGGKVTGGPAQTALPSVGLSVDAEGFLVAATLFSRRPGISA
jgi:rieske iron-sulfur protein